MTVPATRTAPRSVVTSFRLHVAGAVLHLVIAALALILLPQTIATTIEVTRRAARSSTTTPGFDVVSVATGVAVGSAVVGTVLAIVFSILTVLFARKMLAGRNWARIVLTVFAGLQLFGVGTLYGLGALHFLVLAAAVVFSFLPLSNAWFRDAANGTAL